MYHDSLRRTGEPPFPKRDDQYATLGMSVASGRKQRQVDALLDRFPLFLRDDASLPIQE